MLDFKTTESIADENFVTYKNNVDKYCNVSNNETRPQKIKTTHRETTAYINT